MTKIILSNKAKTKELDPPLNKYATQIASCALEDLGNTLDSIDTTTTWKKTDLSLWAEVLNRFDDILENAVHSSLVLTLGETPSPKPNTTSSATTAAPAAASSSANTTPSKKASGSKDKASTSSVQVPTLNHTPNAELLIKIIKFTTHLIDHCRNKNVYQSVERIVSLLNSENLDIIRDATQLLHTLLRKNLYSTFASTIDGSQGMSQLLTLSYGYGANSILLTCRDHANIHPEVMKKGSGVHFEFYSDPSKDKSLKRKSQSQRSSLGARTIDLTPEDLSVGSEQLFQTFLQLVKTHHVPADQKFSLWTRMRMAHSFSSLEQRRKFCLIRLRALTTICFAQAQDLVPTFLRHQPDITSELRDVLEEEESEGTIPRNIASTAMETLSSFFLLRTKNVNVVSELVPSGSSAYNGILPKILCSITDAFQRDSKHIDIEYCKSFFGLITCIGSSAPGIKALYDAGILHDMVSLLGLVKNKNLIVTELCLKVMDLLASPERERTNWINLATIQQVMSIINANFELCRAEMNTQDAKKTVKDTLSPIQLSVLQLSFKIMHSVVRNRSGELNAREVLEGEDGILKVMNDILSHAAYFESFFFSYAASIVSQLMNIEPTCIALIVRSGTLNAILDLLENGLPANADVIYAIPPLFFSISLNAQGIEEITSRSGLKHLFKTLIDPKYVKALTKDASVLLGKDLHDFIRQHSNQRESIIQMMIDFIKELSNHPLLVHSQNEEESISTEQEEQIQLLIKCANNTIKATGSLVQNSTENGRILIEKQGLQSIISLIKSCLFKQSKGSTSTVDTMINSLKSVSRNQPLPVLTEIIQAAQSEFENLQDFDETNTLQMKSLNVVSYMLKAIYTLFNHVNQPMLPDWSKSTGNTLLPALAILDSTVRFKLAKHLSTKQQEQKEDKKKKKSTSATTTTNTTPAVASSSNQGSSSSTATTTAATVDAKTEQENLLVSRLLKFVSSSYQLYDTLQKAVFYGTRQFESRANAAQAPPATAITLSTALAHNLIVPLTTYQNRHSEMTTLEHKCTYLSGVLFMIHNVLISERHKNTNTIILDQMDRQGGLKLIFEIYQQVMLEVLNHSQSTVPSDSESKKLNALVVEFTINATRLIQKLSSLDYVATSLLTPNMLFATPPFNTPTFMNKIHKSISNVIVELWNHPHFSQLNPECIMLFINVVAHVIKGIESESDGESSLNQLMKATAPPAPIQINDVALSNLQEMGFTRGVAREALRRTANNVNAAIEFLFSNPELVAPDEDDEESSDEAENEEEEEEDESEEAIMRRAIQMSLQSESKESESEKATPEVAVESDNIKTVREQALDWILNISQNSKSLTVPATDVLSLIASREPKDSTVVIKSILNRISNISELNVEKQKEQYASLSGLLSVLLTLVSQLLSLRSLLLSKEYSLIGSLSNVIRHAIEMLDQQQSSPITTNSDSSTSNPSTIANALLTSIFNLFEYLSQPPSLNQPSTSPNEKEKSNKMNIQELIERNKSNQLELHDQELLLKIGITCLDKQSLSSGMLKSIFKILSNVTNSFPMAQEALRQGLLEKMLTMTVNTPTLYPPQTPSANTRPDPECKTYAEGIIKHMVEDAETLQVSAEVYIRRRFASLLASHGHITTSTFLQHFVHKIERDPQVFFAAVQNVCKMVGSNVVLKEVVPESDKQPKQHSKEMKFIVESLIKALLKTPLVKSNETDQQQGSNVGGATTSGNSTTTPSKDKSKSTSSESNQPVPLFEKHNYLKILADFVFIYKCGDLIISFDSDLINKLTPASSPDLISYLIHDLLPYPCNPTMKEVNDPSIIKKFDASRMASFLLSTLTSHHAQIVLTSVCQHIKNSGDKPLQVIQCLCDFLYSIFNTMIKKRNLNGTNHQNLDEISKIMIDLDIPSALSGALEKIDLNHPDAPDVTNSILKPIEILVRKSNGVKKTNQEESSTSSADLDLDYTVYLNEYARMENDPRFSYGHRSHSSASQFLDRIGHRLVRNEMIQEDVIPHLDDQEESDDEEIEEEDDDEVMSNEDDEDDDDDSQDQEMTHEIQIGNNPPDVITWVDDMDQDVEIIQDEIVQEVIADAPVILNQNGDVIDEEDEEDDDDIIDQIIHENDDDDDDDQDGDDDDRDGMDQPISIRQDDIHHHHHHDDHDHDDEDDEDDEDSEDDDEEDHEEEEEEEEEETEEYDFGSGQGSITWDMLRQFAEENDESEQAVVPGAMRALANSLAPDELQSLLSTLQRGAQPQITISSTGGHYNTITFQRIPASGNLPFDRSGLINANQIPTEYPVHSQYEAVYNPNAASSNPQPLRPLGSAGGLFGGLTRARAPSSRLRYTFSDLLASEFGNSLSRPPGASQRNVVPTGLDQSLVELLQPPRSTTASTNAATDDSSVATGTDSSSNANDQNNLLQEMNQLEAQLGAQTGNLNDRLNELERMFVAVRNETEGIASEQEQQQQQPAVEENQNVQIEAADAVGPAPVVGPEQVPEQLPSTQPLQAPEENQDSMQVDSEESQEMDNSVDDEPVDSTIEPQSSTTASETTNNNAQQEQQPPQPPQEFAIDPTFLAALPDEIRHEILINHISQLVNTTQNPVQGESTISPDFLNALPEDIRNEVLEQERVLQQHQQTQQDQAANANNNQAANAPGAADADMDAAAFIASLAPDLRQEVLMTSDEAVINLLPPDLVNEAYALRQNYYHRQLRQRRIAQNNHPERGAAATAVNKMLNLLDKPEEEDANLKPIFNSRDISCILKLLYMSRSLSKQLILKILGHLCEHSESRYTILYLLMGILEHHDVNDPKIPEMIAPLMMSTVFGVPSYAGFTLRSNTNSVPHSITKRFLELLVALSKLPRVLPLLARPETNLPSLLKISDSKNESIMNKLFGFLSEPYYNSSGKMLEQIMQLIDACIEYLNRMIKTYRQEIKKIREHVDNLNEQFKNLSSELNELKEKIAKKTAAETTTQQESTTVDKQESSSKENEDDDDDDDAQDEEESKEELQMLESNLKSIEESLKKDSEKLEKIQVDNEHLDKQMNQILSTDSIRQLVHVLTKADTSENTVKLLISIMNHMSGAMPQVSRLILREMGDVAIKEAHGVVDVLSAIKSSNKKGASSSSSRPKENKKLLQELKFCRILRTYSAVMKQEKKKILQKEKKDSESNHNQSSQQSSASASSESGLSPINTSSSTPDIESLHYLKESSLDFVWNALEKYLDTIQPSSSSSTTTSNQHNDMMDQDHDPLVNQRAAAASTSSSKKNLALYSSLLPLVEAFFQFHSGFQTEKQDENEVNLSEMMSETPTPTTSRSINGSRVESFLEKNRTFLNELVRTSPNLLTNSLSLLMKHPKYVDFDNKRTWFRAKIHQEQQKSGLGTLPITVRRSNLMADSYNALINRSVQELKDRINVQFAHEAAVDAGGVSREWFLLISREMLNPMYALFIQSLDKTTYQPNPASGINKDHLSYFRFVGRVIALAIYNEQLLDCYFTRSLYKHILGTPISYHDIESIDPEYYKNLKWMLDNDITDVVDYTFTQEMEEFGQRKTVELKPGGKNIAVTNENKMEYVKLATELKMTKLIEHQLTAFLSSFFEIIPKELISVFNEQELELLMSGLPEIDIDDLKKNTEYAGYSSNSDVVRWFWNVVDGLNQHEKALLLQFVTGTSKVPLDGFKSLLGTSGIQRFNIHRVPGDTDLLPTSHTCFNQLDLPEYSSEEVLRERLLLAIRIGAAGFGFV